MLSHTNIVFNTAGPCISTDTACSSSLVATHLAHKALQSEECSMAVSAGTNVMIRAGTTAAICQLQALSSVGRCKSFESSADGYGRGEGVAALVMCRTSGRSLLDMSASAHALALVHGSALNQGGRSSGLTAPNGPAQATLIRTAIINAQASMNQLKIVSVHGTGTPLGDPIEVGGLMQVLSDKSGPGKMQESVIALLSNKSCYGHTEGTAGITGLLLAIMSLSQHAAPEVMHLRNLNPYVAAALGNRAGCNMRATLQTAPNFTASTHLAGSSSFGMSGVNAHMIMAQTVEMQNISNKVNSLLVNSVVNNNSIV